MVAAWADKLLVCFPESAKHYRHPEKVEVVGMPVKREFIYTKKADARAELKLDNRPVVVSAYGSQGARAMNEITAELFALEQKANFPFRHIHAYGGFARDWMPDYVAKKGIDLNTCSAITMQEYIYNMPTVMAAADVIISRAGASSCSEIAASGTPCILIPSPNVTNDHQTKNARILAQRGGAVMLLEQENMGQKIYDTVTELLADPERLAQMSVTLRQTVVLDSAERFCDLIQQLSTKA
jgi:UDP-N-acetylglucosamine--N-acetylmuramyl-(pentapeptide) pyrophosphoryl-undecaprenol N-acetylglucosamine transferase